MSNGGKECRKCGRTFEGSGTICWDHRAPDPTPAPARHTPGPWAWRENLGDLGAQCTDLPGTHSVLSAEGGCDECDYARTLKVWCRPADKALISAAPDLASALVELLDLWKANRASWAPGYERGKQALHNSEAALRKAGLL